MSVLGDYVRKQRSPTCGCRVASLTVGGRRRSLCCWVLLWRVVEGVLLFDDAYLFLHWVPLWGHNLFLWLPSCSHCLYHYRSTSTTITMATEHNKSSLTTTATVVQIVYQMDQDHHRQRKRVVHRAAQTGLGILPWKQERAR